MARDPKDKPNPKPTQPRFNDVNFINWSLSAEEKAACKQWALDVASYDSDLGRLIQSDYKLTLSWDGFRSCYTASIVPTKDNKINAGYILTGKGSTPLKAAKQALYIHFYVMAEEWAAYSTAGAAEELDD